MTPKAWPWCERPEIEGHDAATFYYCLDFESVKVLTCCRIFECDILPKIVCSSPL